MIVATRTANRLCQETPADGFELFVPTAALSIDAIAARRRWLLRTLAKAKN